LVIIRVRIIVRVIGRIMVKTTNIIRVSHKIRFMDRIRVRLTVRGNIYNKKIIRVRV